ncbi:hypothetical protein NE237_013996 [Protea cynaroides]|uniref:Uncharacterized protein n=1 Tax=Protea cynaroides TaxID=273540 RepID=A0A9Q0K0P0_9MAGN|nr:hypothetical protein NE237_013996 [Protea cynaroides]
MSKKNSLSRRKKQYDFDLQREKQEKEKREKNLQAKKTKMKIDGSGKKKKGSGGFQVGKRKVKTKLTALAKAKASQAMEVKIFVEWSLKASRALGELEGRYQLQSFEISRLLIQAFNCIWCLDYSSYSDRIFAKRIVLWFKIKLLRRDKLDYLKLWIRKLRRLSSNR